MANKTIKNILVALIISVAFISISAGTASAVYCSGAFPQSFYGNIDISNADAPAGTQIRAAIAGEIRNYYNTTALGIYGNAQTQDKFGVAGKNEGYDPNIYEIPPGVTFEILVNNVWTPAILNNSFNSTPYICSTVSNLNLNANVQQCPDSDQDEVCDSEDQCPGSDDAVDTDGDGNADGCDACPNDNPDDSDQDGVCDTDDLCPGENDAFDADGDGAPNGCDPCPLNNPDDSDGDGSCDFNDICEGQNDFLDSDDDSIPDCLDFCPQDPTNDLDEDEVCGQSDNCPETYNLDQNDADLDGIGDVCDEDAADNDGDGFAEDDGDCDDQSDVVFPGAEEDCDNVDNDCDEGTADGVDEPGYGDVTACGIGECASAGVFTCVNGQMSDTCQEDAPQQETCDGLDNDCNGAIDNGALITFFQDFDVDTYGNPIIVQDACQAPQGYVANDDDCNDNNVNINPAAQEVCDGADNDCDSQIDEGDVCGQGCEDEDQDEVCDNEDLCDGFPNVDDDNDGVCNGIDTCPADPDNDADGDGICEPEDICPGFDDGADWDTDGTPDGCDSCPNDEFNDIDDDNLCQDADPCPANPENDADGDGQCENIDTCPADPENDADGDEIPDCIDDNVEETFQASIQIYDGWTLFALPFDPLGIDDSGELGQAINNAGADCDVIMRYNGNAQQWEDDLLGQPDPSFSLIGTEGYFIHCNSAVEFDYEGTAWV